VTRAAWYWLGASAAAFAAAAGVSRFQPNADLVTWALLFAGAILLGVAIAARQD
jgi:hypothetical protein